MSLDHATAPLQIAVSTGIMPPALATLLAKQRMEEPETPVRLIETTEKDQHEGLKDGRYCLGLFLSMNEPPLARKAFSLSGKTNWHWLCLRVRRYWLLPKFRLERQYRTP